MTDEIPEDEVDCPGCKNTKLKVEWEGTEIFTLDPLDPPTWFAPKPVVVPSTTPVFINFTQGGGGVIVHSVELLGFLIYAMTGQCKCVEQDCVQRVGCVGLVSASVKIKYTKDDQDLELIEHTNHVLADARAACGGPELTYERECSFPEILLPADLQGISLSIDSIPVSITVKCAACATELDEEGNEQPLGGCC